MWQENTLAGQFKVHPVRENGSLLQTVSHVAVACYIKQADRHRGIQLLFDWTLELVT